MSNTSRVNKNIYFVKMVEEPGYFSAVNNDISVNF
jgi:hypothetical protein